MEKWKNFIFRSFDVGIRQVWRNRFLSLNTIVLCGTLLFLLNFIFVIQYVMDLALKKVEQKAEFTVPVNSNYDSFDLTALFNEIDNKYNVQRYFKSEEIDTDFHNVQILPNRFRFQFTNLKEVQPVFEILKKARYDTIVSIDIDDYWRDHLIKIQHLLFYRYLLDRVSFVLFILFLFGGIIIFVNTFRMGLFSRKDEIFISRLVGADSYFITSPFLVEGLILGILSGFMSIILTILVLREIPGLPQDDIFIYLWQEVFQLEILVAASIGVIGAWFAVKRYLVGKYD